MPDYRGMTRQHGFSSNPIYESNPRRFARTRCEKAMNACDRIIMYMGELIQTYKPEDMSPSEAVKEGLELAQYCADQGVDLAGLIDLAYLGDAQIGSLGKFAGYITIAALLMRTAQETRDTIAELRSTI